MKLKYMIPALCICTCTAMPEMLHAQDDSLKKDSTERPFNAMDYVLQERAMTEMFSGTLKEEPQTFTIRLTPKEMNNEVAFRFSKPNWCIISSRAC